MVRDRQVFQSFFIEYSGTPSVTVSVDGTQVFSSTLPDHSVRKTRRVLLPQEAVGYIAEMQSGGSDVIRHTFQGVPDSSFSAQKVFQGFEVTFTGSVKLRLTLDGVDKRVNESDTTITLAARKSRNQDTRRVYFPPLGYGYIPHLEQESIDTVTGEVVGFRPIALPPKFYKGLRDHSEVQATHQGEALVKVFLDGNEVAEFLFPGSAENPDQFLTNKQFLPAGVRGHVFQWIQTRGDGEVALFETDTTILDKDQPQQEV